MNSTEKSDTANVVHVVAALETGGLERMVCQLAASRERSRTRVLCLHDAGSLGRQLEQNGFHVEVLPPGRRHTRILELRARLRQWSADIVHCHNLQAYTWGGLAAATLRNASLVLTKHGMRMSGSAGVGERLRRWLARRSYLVGVSRQIQQQLADWAKRDPGEVAYIPNGLDLSPYNFAVPSQTIRRRLDWPDDAFVAISVARLSAEKDHRTLLHAFRRVVTAQPSALLALVGSGPLDNHLVQLTEVLRLKPHVRFLGERSDVPELLTASDVAVLSSRTEGLPLSLIEAMAAKLPVVATRVGGVPVIVRHGANGLLVPAEAPDRLAAALLQLAQYPLAARRMGRFGREMVERHFTLQHVSERYEQLYQSMRQRAA